MTQKDSAACSKGKAFALATAVAGARVTSWTAFTPTGSWTANTTYYGMFRVVGDTLEVRIAVHLAGAPTSASLTVQLPRTIDVVKLLRAASTDGSPIVGSGMVLDFGTASYGNVVAVVTSSMGTDPVGVYTVSPTDAAFAAVTQAAPITFANGDRIHLNIQVPIA